MNLRIISLIPFCFLLPDASTAQIHFSYEFTQKIKENELEFIEPVEGFYKPVPYYDDDISDYDLVIFSEEKDVELRFIIQPDRPGAVDDFPLITSYTLANSLAINDSSHLIVATVLPPTKVDSLYSADWAMIVDFVPKELYTFRRYGKLISLYKENRGMVHTIILYNEPDDEVEVRMQTLSFQP